MAIEPSVAHSIMVLEDVVQTRWIHRILFLCPDEEQCKEASRILSSLDYVVETILPSTVYEEREDLYYSIDRLKKGLSKVLVTTPEMLSMIQKNQETQLRFDVVL